MIARLSAAACAALAYVLIAGQSWAAVNDTAVFAQGWCPRGWVPAHGQLVTAEAFPELAPFYPEHPDERLIARSKIFQLPDLRGTEPAPKVTVCLQAVASAYEPESTIGFLIRSCGGDTVPAAGQDLSIVDYLEITAVLAYRFGDNPPGRVSMPMVPGYCLVVSGTFPAKR